MVSSKRLQKCVFLITDYLTEIISSHIQTFGSDLLKDYILTFNVHANGAKHIHVDLNLQYVGTENFRSIFEKFTLDSHQIMHDKSSTLIHALLVETYHNLIEKTATHIEIQS